MTEKVTKSRNSVGALLQLYMDRCLFQKSESSRKATLTERKVNTRVMTVERKMAFQQEHDVIVVGSGAAGCLGKTLIEGEYRNT